MSRPREQGARRLGLGRERAEPLPGVRGSYFWAPPLSGLAVVLTVDVNVSSRQTRPQILGANSGRTVRVAESASTSVPVASKECLQEGVATVLLLVCVFAVSTRGKPSAWMASMDIATL